MIELSWSKYLELTEKLYKKIVDKFTVDGKAIVPFTSVIGINRGGNILATILSHKFHIPCGIVSAKNTTYNESQLETAGVIVNRHVSMVMLKPGCLDYVLLVDDIADTGETLWAVAKRAECICANKICVATLVYKRRSRIVPDFYAVVAPDDSWVKFPYETGGGFNPQRLHKASLPYPPSDNPPPAQQEEKSEMEVNQMNVASSLSEMLKKARRVVGEKKRKVFGRKEQVEALIAENPNITNREICEKIGIHPSYLVRIRKKIGR